MINPSMIPEMPSTDAINARSEKLLEEFRAHADEVIASMKSRGTPVDGDAREEVLLYEGWSAQKLASLQLLAETQAGIIALLLEEALKRK